MTQTFFALGFFLRVVKAELYKDIPFWTVLLGEDFYLNHSFWSKNDGTEMIYEPTLDDFFNKKKF